MRASPWGVTGCLVACLLLLLTSSYAGGLTEAGPDGLSHPTDFESKGCDNPSPPPAVYASVLNPNPPSQPVKLIFIHHSTGGNWLANPNQDQPYGGLGVALMNNNYFVSATNYGWEPYGIGDRTDIVNWPEWFTGPNRNTILAALYNENGQNIGDFGYWSRLATNPGGENQIIMFKSCFPNSDLYGHPDDPPYVEPNDWEYSVSNAKAVYNNIRTYFATRQDKLFVVITAPPLMASETAPERAANARAFNNWLVNDWLAGYPYNNVAVFDYYNVLTSNGSISRVDDPTTNEEPNDAGWADGNHHRWWNGAVQHVQTTNNNYSAYPSGDSHPTTAGHQKATGEFVPLLNVFYNRWQSIQATPTATPTRTPTSRTPTATAQRFIYLPLVLKRYPSLPLATLTATPTSLPLATPTATPTPTQGVGSLDVPLTVRETAGQARTAEPVTSGVPVPRSLSLTNLAALRLLDNSGQPVPAQFTPLARWGGAPTDASKPVRWLLLDFPADVPANGAATYRLVNSGGPTPTYPTLSVSDSVNAVTVNTGAGQFSVSKINGNLTAPNLSAPLVGRAIAPPGTVYTTTGPVTVTIALRGPMRAAVQVEGTYRSASGTALLSYTSRYWFYAGQPIVRLFHTVENNNLCPLGEYEQLACFDIGSGGSVTVTDLSLVLPTSLSGPLTYQVGGQGAPVSGSLTANLLLYQDSSGTDHWNRYPTMTDWQSNPLDTRPRMQSYVSFRGYRTTLGTTVVDSGDQAAGWLSIAGTNGRWSVGIRDFWQNFPKALRTRNTGTIEIGLFPDEFGPAGYGFNLRAGEHKTQEVVLKYSSPPLLAGEGLGVGVLFAQAPAQWYVDSGAFGLTALRQGSDWPDHEQYIDYQLTTSPSHDMEEYFQNLLDAIQSTDFYGLFDYGDWPIDYEGYEVAPLNPKYDNDYGMWLQWARGGDARWFALAEAADRHLADVDILHNLHSPRHWGDGIVFGHSEHDEDGFVNPHRNRNSGHPDIAFGLPGLLATYYLTGYEKAYEAALELADCLEYRLHNDEHLCSYFADCSGQGHAVGGDGLAEDAARSAANSLFIVVQAYRATADSRYLAVADAVADWADPAVQPFMNCPTGASGSMRPWQFNMYLRALADYLEVRGEFSLPDTYGARSSFLTYANWLRTCPWLDLTPIDTGPRAAYPFEWWFDDRAENNDPSINNWLLLGADAMAYAYRLSGEADYLERATRLFRAGSRDPWYEGDGNFYAECKETINSISFGHTFLHEWEAR